MMDAETFALIVGGGPVGLSAAIELNWRGVPAMLVTDKLETAQHPKCNNTNARSMEHFRRLGIADELRSEGLPPDVARASAYVTRFCGHEFGRLPRPYSDWPTPEIPNNVSQIVLERVLRRCAERAPGAQIHFGWRLHSFAAQHDDVIADVENAQTGERGHIQARYLLGIDGAGSTVRRALGFGMIGDDGTTHRAFMGGTMLSFFIRAPTLMAASRRPPTNMTWIINPEMRAMMYSQDGRETWVVHYQVPEGTDWRTVDARAVIAAMIGADVPFEIISGGPWTGGLALVAEHYQAGPGVPRRRRRASVHAARRPRHEHRHRRRDESVLEDRRRAPGLGRAAAGRQLRDRAAADRRAQLATRRAMHPGHGRLGAAAGLRGRRRRRADAARAASARASWRRTGRNISPSASSSASATRIRRSSGRRRRRRPARHLGQLHAARPPGRTRAAFLAGAEERAVFDEFGQGFTLIDFGAPEGDARVRAAAATRGVPLKIIRLAPPEETLPQQARAGAARSAHRLARRRRRRCR